MTTTSGCSFRTSGSTARPSLTAPTTSNSGSRRLRSPSITMLWSSAITTFQRFIDHLDWPAYLEAQFSIEYPGGRSQPRPADVAIRWLMPLSLICAPSKVAGHLGKLIVSTVCAAFRALIDHYRKPCLHLRSLPDFRMNQEPSPDHAQAFSHAQESEAALLIRRFGVKSQAVVLDPQYQVAAFDIQQNPQTTRL